MSTSSFQKPPLSSCVLFLFPRKSTRKFVPGGGLCYHPPVIRYACVRRRDHFSLLVHLITRVITQHTLWNETSKRIPCKTRGAHIQFNENGVFGKISSTLSHRQINTNRSTFALAPLSRPVVSDYVYTCLRQSMVIGRRNRVTPQFP